MSGESRSVAFIVGLALYWQAIINQIFPPSLFGTIAGGFGPHAGYTTGVCLMIAALGVVFFAGRKHLVRFCQNLSLTLVCLLVLFSLSVVVFAFLDEGTMGYMFACSINAFLYSLLIFVLTFLWARRFESFSGSGPLFEVALSFACSVLIAFVGSQVASLLSVHEGQLQIIYPPLSGALLLTTTGVRRIAWVDYREGLACVTDRIGKSPQFMACGILGMYLLFSSAYWSVNTEGMGESVSSIMREPSHKLLLLLMALVFSAAVLKRPSILTKHSYFVPCFVALCIGVLYVVALFWDSLVGVCNAVVLPTRAFSMLLLWLLLMVMAKDYSISFSMLAASFFLPVISITWLVAYVFYGTWGAISSIIPSQTLMLALVLAAAFVLMVLTFKYLALQRNSTLPAISSDSHNNLSNDRSQACVRLGERFLLTEREMDVLMLLSEGNTKKKIAEELHVSVGSVQTYSKGLYAKLGVHSKQEVIDLVKCEILKTERSE